MINQNQYTTDQNDRSIEDRYEQNYLQPQVSNFDPIRVAEPSATYDVITNHYGVPKPTDMM